MKPKVAFFDFASCEGCQLALLNCEDVFLDLLEQIELVEFREAISEKSSSSITPCVVSKTTIVSFDISFSPYVFNVNNIEQTNNANVFFIF